MFDQNEELKLGVMVRFLAGEGQMLLCCKTIHTSSKQALANCDL